jgi:hypothetical protein
MAEQQTQPPTTAKRGRPAGQAKTTASSGNSNRRTHKPSLSGRMGALERTIAQQGDLLKRIARGVSA